MYNGNLTVVVFAAANIGKNHGFVDLAYDMGREIANAGFILANGAGPGLMSETSRGVKEAGGYVVGVGLKGEPPNPYNDVYKERVGIHSRQNFLFSFGDAFIGLPGGMGTFYEAIEISELKKLGEEEPEPVILINHEGFFDGFKRQLQTMRDCGFIPEPWNQYIDVVDTPSEAIRIIRSFYDMTSKNGH